MASSQEPKSLCGQVGPKNQLKALYVDQSPFSAYRNSPKLVSAPAMATRKAGSTPCAWPSATKVAPVPVIGEL